MQIHVNTCKYKYASVGNGFICIDVSLLLQNVQSLLHRLFVLAQGALVLLQTEMILFVVCLVHVLRFSSSLVFLETKVFLFVLIFIPLVCKSFVLLKTLRSANKSTLFVLIKKSVLTY